MRAQVGDERVIVVAQHRSGDRAVASMREVRQRCVAAHWRVEDKLFLADCDDRAKALAIAAAYHGTTVRRVTVWRTVR